MGASPLGLADLVQGSFPPPRDGPAVEASGTGAAALAGEELRDLSAELSSLLRDLASTPEIPVDVSFGWSPGLVPGDVVGRYHLMRLVGSNGFGVTYEAVDLARGGAVAFKAIRPGRLAPTRSQEWLRAEAEAVGRLSHPGIVTPHDFGRGPSGPYLVFDLLEGETLARRLEDGPVPLPVALGIGVQVARALVHAHRAGVVHRDLEPANVVLLADGTVKLLDFGLSYLFGRGGTVGGGAHAYLAPEQWRSLPGDGRTDVFALGVLIHHMVSGEAPYRTARGVSDALRAGPPPLLARSAAPAALRELVARMLEKDARARPQSAQAVLEELVSVQRRLESRGRLHAL